MWVVGDDLLSSSTAQLMNWRNNAGRNHYINKNYEVTPYTVTDTNNFILQIQLGLARAINANNFLPEIILVVLSNIIPSDQVLFAKYEFYLNTIMRMIRENVTKRHDQLPKKARAIFGTKIVITKALPKPEDQEFKIRRRKYNKQMDYAARQFNIEAIHVSDIIPSNQEMFEGPDLSEIGKKKFWTMISEKIKLLDTSDVEAVMNRRRERITGEMDANPNSFIYLNLRRRYPNTDQYLGVRINGAQNNVENQARNNHNRRIAENQRDHRIRMDRMEQLRRQGLINEYIDRRNRRYGPNGAANWGALMSFIQNMERRSNENIVDYQDRVNEVFNRRAGRLFQSGDGAHIDSYNRRRNQDNRL